MNNKCPRKNPSFSFDPYFQSHPEKYMEILLSEKIETTRAVMYFVCFFSAIISAYLLSRVVTNSCHGLLAPFYPLISPFISCESPESVRSHFPLPEASKYRFFTEIIGNRVSDVKFSSYKHFQEHGNHFFQLINKQKLIAMQKSSRPS